MEEPDRSTGLRASSIIRELDDILNKYENCSIEGTTETQRDSINSGTENGFAIDKEWDELLKHNLVKSKGNCRTQESVLISEAFSFLPESNDETTGGERNGVLGPNNRSSDEVGVVIDATVEDRNSVPGSDDPDGTQGDCAESAKSILRAKSEELKNEIVGQEVSDVSGKVEPDLRETRVISDAFGFLKKEGKQTPDLDETQLEDEPENMNSILRTKSVDCEERRIVPESPEIPDPVIRETRVISDAFGFLKNEENSKTSDERQNVAQAEDLDQRTPELRDTRVISNFFGFLKDEDIDSEFADYDNKLSTVIENENENDDLESVASTASMMRNKGSVIFRDKSRSPVQKFESTSDSSLDQAEDDSGDDDEDDDGIHLIPGAWRNSAFAYVGPDCDTASEGGSRSSSPKVNEAATPSRTSSSNRPISMFPPSPVERRRSKMSSSTSVDSGTSQARRNTSSTFQKYSSVENGAPPEVRLLSATDSETSGDVFQDEDALNRSEDSDAFENVTDLIHPQKKKKGKKMFLKSKSRSDSVSSSSTTVSEREFRSKYKSLQRTRILRKASTIEIGPKKQHALSDEVDHFISLEKTENMQSFGFHIWGRKPVIVSTIVPGSLAEEAGLKIGDVLVSVNDINIIESSTNEVVQITGRGTRKVKLGIGSGNLAADIPVCCGYLYKQCGTLLMKKWRKRWLELKADHCLYYYKSEGDVDPLGAVPVHNYSVTKAPDISSNKEFTFKLTKFTSKTYYFSADTDDEMSQWANAINIAAENRNKASNWLDISAHNVSLPALDIRKPDCHGYLWKMGNSTKTWRKRYCVLKDACLYYYLTCGSNTAKGVVHFHGYKVQGSMPYKKLYGFMLIPPEPEMRTFYFQAENETEHRRWITAFQDSISNWVQIE